MQKITKERIDSISNEHDRTSVFQVARAVVSDSTINEDDYMEIFQAWLDNSVFDESDYGYGTMFWEMIDSVKIKFGETPLDDIIIAADPSDAPDCIKMKGLRLVNKLASVCLLLDELKSPFPLAQSVLAQKLSTSQSAISSAIRILTKADFLEVADKTYRFASGSKGQAKRYRLKNSKCGV